MTHRARFLAPIVLVSLILAGIGVGSSPAIAASKPKTPDHILTIASVPSSHPRSERMFAFGNSHFAAAAAKLPAGLVSALNRDLKLSPEAYLAEADAAARAVQVVSELKANGIHVLGSKMNGTALEVNVATAAAADAVRAVGATAVMGAPRPLAQHSVAKAVSNVYPGEPYFSTWNSDPGLVGQCTIGFTGFKETSGAAEVLSAGHCAYYGSKVADKDYTYPDGDPGVITQNQYDGSVRLGTVAKELFGDGYDSSLVTLSAGITQTPNLATWGGVNAAGLPNSTVSIAVTGETEAIVNAPLCKSGSRTGYTCGAVLAVNQPVEVEGDNGKIHSVNSIIATTCVKPGDSGGSAVTGSLGVGVTSSASTQYPCSDRRYFSGFFPLVAASSHPSVKKQYGSSWELQVSLSPAALTHPAGPGTTLHSTDSLTGTVGNPALGDYVAIYLDGATSTSRTASVSSDGTWSYPLTTVPEGAHTFTIDNRFGTYSASTPISSSMNIIQKVAVTKPTISGTAQVGDTMTAKTTVTPDTAGVSYQWLSGGADVGTNQSTYVPVASDHGNTITVTVTGSASGYDSSDPSTSSQTRAVVHGTLMTHKLVVTGNRNVGQLLTATTAAWAPAGVDLTYQWLRNGKKIADATASTYEQVAADHDTKIDVTVTGTLDGYTTESVTSTATSTETANPLFATTSIPTIDDANPAVKDVLSANPGSWSPGAPTFTYQWRENGHSISGATKSTYPISTSYAGKLITVTVTGKETGFATTSVTSAATAAVASIPFSAAETAAFSGATPDVKGAVVQRI